MQVNLKLTLEQANVVRASLEASLRTTRGIAALKHGTPEENLECQRQVMEIEQTMRALGLTVPEPPKASS